MTTDVPRYVDALGDYYDSGAIGQPPRREMFLLEEELKNKADK